MSLNLAKANIIDYGIGNIASVYNIFKSLGVRVTVSNLEDDIINATHLVLPGVGSFAAAAKKIRDLRSFELLKKEIIDKKKLFLGICVGMQILADEGYEEGKHAGLGWIPGKVRYMDLQKCVLPHIGWNNLNIVREDRLLKNIDNSTDFYFVHSYFFDPDDKSHVIAKFEYENEFTAVVNKENMFGVQFHPEKSQKAGRALLENFLNL